MKMFIDSNFKMVDLNDDGIIAADEYRFNCITKFAIDDIEVVDEAFNNLLSVRKKFNFCLFNVLCCSICYIYCFRTTIEEEAV